jgi:hypothetical protein
LKPWLLSKIVAQKCSECLAVHLSKLRFDKQALNACLATFQLELSAPLSQQNSVKTFFCICTTFPTLGGSPLGVLWLLDLSGACSLKTSTTGPDPACTANRGKIHHHTRLLLQPIPIPQQGFTHLHIDLVGPLQYSIAGQKIIKVLTVY